MVLQCRSSRSWRSAVVLMSSEFAEDLPQLLLVTGICFLAFLSGTYAIQKSSFISSRFGLRGVMFCIVQQKEFFFSRYPHVTCPAGVYLLGKLLRGIWVGSWRWLQQFCSIALAKTLNMFWLWEEKERNTEVMVVIILLWEFSLWLEDYLVAYAKWNSCSGRQKSK